MSAVAVFGTDGFLDPQLSLETQAFTRIAYGILLLGTLLMALPQGRRFFMSERWGGYAQSSPEVDVLQNPIAYPIVMAIWLLSAVLIALGWWSPWAALANLLLCRYFFIRMRWKGVLRGMGAPGFMTYWLAAAVFLLEYTLHYAPDLRPLALLALQVDLALIMLSAGLYKYTAGYARSHGMEFGMVNPQWGYWWRTYKDMPPGHGLFRVLNHLGWSTEVVMAALMVVPATRFLGGLLLIVSFAFIATQIRLGLLCHLVVLSGVLFFHPGSLGDQALMLLVPASATSSTPALAVWSAINFLLAAALWAYLILLPIAHAGLFYNFYLRRSLPGPLQVLLERYTNFFGMIIWRVFSVDHTNFFVQIYHQPRGGGPRTLISRYTDWKDRRYRHVAESITVTTLFTTLKYYASNPALFAERVLRYARTVPHPPKSVLVLEYVSIVKAADRFELLPVAEYVVDVAAGTVEERTLSEAVSVRAAHAVSPVHEGVRPGSYVPAGR